MIGPRHAHSVKSSFKITGQFYHYVNSPIWKSRYSFTEFPWIPLQDVLQKLIEKRGWEERRKKSIVEESQNQSTKVIEKERKSDLVGSIDLFLSLFFVWDFYFFLLFESLWVYGKFFWIGCEGNLLICPSNSLMFRLNLNVRDCLRQNSSRVFCLLSLGCSGNGCRLFILKFIYEIVNILDHPSLFCCEF